ncbi:MAG: EF-P beta-lysylation protein EpmB, partial [Pirellula staleyi]
MIGSLDSTTWQKAMKAAIRDSLQLCQALGIDPNELPISANGERQFPVFVPLEFLARMKHGDPFDPLLLQVTPRLGEDIASPDFTSDPVGDCNVEMAPGLLHKYEGRVLLIV